MIKMFFVLVVHFYGENPVGDQRGENTIDEEEGTISAFGKEDYNSSDQIDYYNKW